MEEPTYKQLKEEIVSDPTYKKYWGIKIDKEREGDFSFGACITRDSWLGEFYLYINFFKWSICIGKLTKEI